MAALALASADAALASTSSRLANYSEGSVMRRKRIYISSPTPKTYEPTSSMSRLILATSFRPVSCSSSGKMSREVCTLMSLA